MNARVEQMIRSLDASEAKRQAEERKLKSWRRDMFAASDERARRKSGLSPGEWAERKAWIAARRAEVLAARQQAEEEREQRLREFCGATAPAVLGLPDATAVALALSQKHVGGKAVRMSKLLQEAQLATAEDAERVSKNRAL